LTGGFTGQATRTERVNFDQNLLTLNGDRNLSCPEGDPDRYARLGGRLGLRDLLERVGRTRVVANVKDEDLTQLDYNLQFVIKKDASLTPKFNLVPIGKEKTFTGNLKWTGSSSDTQYLKLVLTPPAKEKVLRPTPVYIVEGPKVVTSKDVTRKGRRAKRGFTVERERAFFVPLPRSGITPEDKEELNRARTRGVLQDVEGQLRRQGIGF
jgi:hypothetical protein